MLRFWTAVAFVAVCIGAGCIELVEDDGGGDGSRGNAPVQTPQMSLSTDQDLALITVVMASSGIDWADFQMRASQPIYAGRNTQATADDPLVSSAYVPMPAGPYLAGDFVDFCAADPPGMPVVVWLLHTQSRTVVYETTLPDVPPCGTITQ